MSLDWTDPSEPVSKYFTVREALWLPHPPYQRMASAGDGLNLEAEIALRVLFQRMDLVREFIEAPIRVHVAFRPRKYNEDVGGAPESAHIARKENGVFIAAVDWSADLGMGSPGDDCDYLRAILIPKLEELGLRMEQLPRGSPWIHTDTRPPGPSGRYFIP